MLQRWKFFKAAGALGMAILLLSAPAEPAEKAKLTIGYSSTGPTAVGLWTAKKIGAFSKYGVEPNFIFISSSPVMVPALIGGDVQCAVAGANAVIAAALGGAPIVAIASLANRPYLRLWAQTEYQRVDELRQALQSGSSLTYEQAQFALEIIAAFERALPIVAAATGYDSTIEKLATLIHEKRWVG